MKIITEEYIWCDRCKDKKQNPCGMRECPIMVDLRDPATKAAYDQWCYDTNR